MKTRQIDKDLKAAHSQDEKTIKLLLLGKTNFKKSLISRKMLGAGECGKSTVLKQMRILHNKKFTDDEMNQQRKVWFRKTILKI